MYISLGTAGDTTNQTNMGKDDYEAPEIQVWEVKVEVGFNESGGNIGSGNEDYVPVIGAWD